MLFSLQMTSHVKKMLFLCSLLCWSTSVCATLRVVVTIKPIHSLITGIMEGMSTPELLLPDGISPHTFQLKPSILKKLQTADLIIWVGPLLEQFMVKTLQKTPSSHIVTLLDIPQLTLYPIRHSKDWQSSDHHHHSHESMDPHFWLSPHNAIILIDYLSHYFANNDKAHATQYLANAKRLKEKIHILQKSLQALLAPIKTRPFLVYHDGYQYFEKAFGLNGAGTMVTNTNLPLSANRLNRVKKFIQSQKIQCVFKETEFNENAIQASLKEESVGVAELDPLGARIPAGSDHYEKTLLKLGETFYECLSKDIR